MNFLYSKITFYLMLIIQLFSFSLFANYLEEYNKLLTDLKNIHTIGYKKYIPANHENSKAFDFFPGSLVLSESDLDIAILGEGFFRVILEDGKFAYTRNGKFSIDANGNLKINQQYNTGIKIPFSKDYQTIKISEDGEIFVITREKKIIELGRIDLFSLENVQFSGGLYISNGIPTKINKLNVTLKPGCLETSNVEPLQTILSLIKSLNKMEKNKLITLNDSNYKIDFLFYLMNNTEKIQEQNSTFMETIINFLKIETDSNQEKIFVKIIDWEAENFAIQFLKANQFQLKKEENTFFIYNDQKTKIILLKLIEALNIRNKITLQNINNQYTINYKKQSIRFNENGKIEIIHEDIFRMVYEPTHPDRIKTGIKKGWVQYPEINLLNENEILKDTIQLKKQILKV